MKTGTSKSKSRCWLLFLTGFLVTGCSEILYYRQWHQPPPSSYLEPGPKKTDEENRNPFYSIDCNNGVACYGPDEERTPTA